MELDFRQGRVRDRRRRAGDRGERDAHGADDVTGDTRSPSCAIQELPLLLLLRPSSMGGRPDLKGAQGVPRLKIFFDV